MNKIEKKLLEKYGKIKGAGTLLAADLKITQPAASMLISGKRKPSKDLMIKLGKVWGLNEEELKQIFNIQEKRASVGGPIKEVENIPTLGILKNKEVIFVPSSSIPREEDVALKRMFKIEVLDSDFPPFQKGQEVHFLAINSMQGNEGSYFIVEEGKGRFVIQKLKTPGGQKIIAIVKGYYVPLD